MTLKMTLIVAASALAFSAGAVAQAPSSSTAPGTPSAKKMTRNEYKASKDRIEAEAKSARASCDRLSANAKDVCQAEAGAKEKIAKAELEADYKNTSKARYDALVAKADAEYAVAKEKCDDKAGKDKDACVKEAKATQATAKADAKSQRNTSASRSDGKPAGRS